MVELSVPNHFMCPISLELMQDPVTLSTGQTYDRCSIEKWFETGHNTCPSTMQTINSNEVAPNRTLQRLIRRWCVSNNIRNDSARDSSRVFNQEAQPQLVKQMLQQVARGADCVGNLKKLKSLARESNHHHENKRVIREAGAIPILANFAFSPENLSKDSLEACELALGILTLLPLQNIRKVVYVGPKQLTAISWLLNRSSLIARMNAALVLASLAHDVNEMKLSVGATAGVFEGLVQLLKEDLYPRAIDAGLKAVLAITPNLERNCVRAVEAGVVFAVAELLPESERRNQDRPLTKLLECLCICPEGRETVSAHALVVPMLVKIICRRDIVASQSAVSCLWTMCQCSPKCVDETAGQVGIMTELSNLIQADDARSSPETKQKGTELFRQLRHRLNNCQDTC